MNRYLAEFLGTFALVFAGTGAVVINDLHGGTVTHVGVALTFGLVVAAAVYALGDVSGAHINPAVSCGFLLAGEFPGRQLLPYIAAQVAGAIAGSLLLRALFEHTTYGATLPAGSWQQSFVLEVVLTWLLMFVILQVVSGPKDQRPLAGLVIGGVVALEAMFAGPVSGASMNPARSVGPAVVSGHLEHLWVYVAAPLLGAALAVASTRAVQERPR